MSKKVLFSVAFLLSCSGLVFGQANVYNNGYNNNQEYYLAQQHAQNNARQQNRANKPSFWEKTKDFLGFGEEEKQQQQNPHSGHGNAQNTQHTHGTQNTHRTQSTPQPQQTTTQRVASNPHAGTTNPVQPNNQPQTQGTTAGTGGARNTSARLTQLQQGIFDRDPTISSNSVETRPIQTGEVHSVPVNPGGTQVGTPIPSERSGGMPTLAKRPGSIEIPSDNPGLSDMDNIIVVEPINSGAMTTTQIQVEEQRTPLATPGEAPRIPLLVNNPRTQTSREEFEIPSPIAPTPLEPTPVTREETMLITEIRPQAQPAPRVTENPQRTEVFDPSPAFVHQSKSLELSENSPQQVRLSKLSPVIEVETIGPQKIILGQDAAYRFKIRNLGNAPAEQVVLSLDLPEWTEIHGAEARVGSTSVQAIESGGNTFTWNVEKIAPGDNETLVLRVIPKERKGFDLNMRYDFKRQTANTKIEVQEPQLELVLGGPDEVLWGSEETYKLRIRNVGNGPAEGVKLTLLPPGGNPAAAKSHTLGDFEPGQEKKLDIKALAKQKDFLDIKVFAEGSYGLKAEVARRVRILRAELVLELVASELQFVGNQVEYQILVRNEGTAPAKDVLLSAPIPKGAVFASSTRDGRLVPAQNQVLWNVASIPVEGEFKCTLVCELKQEGKCQLDLSVAEQSGSSALATATTQVKSIANLAMKVDIPKGPIEIGTESVYSVSVTNNGTKPADNIDIVAAFVEEIEPLRVDNGNGEITKDGVVLFDRIASLGAGDSHTFKIRAKATAAGSHKIRVEMDCRSTGTNLVHEGTAVFYRKVIGSDGSEELLMAEEPRGQGFSKAPPTPAPSPSATPSSSTLEMPSDVEELAMNPPAQPNRPRSGANAPSPLRNELPDETNTEIPPPAFRIPIPASNPAR